MASRSVAVYFISGGLPHDVGREVEGDQMVLSASTAAQFLHQPVIAAAPKGQPYRSCGSRPEIISVR